MRRDDLTYTLTTDWGTVPISPRGTAAELNIEEPNFVSSVRTAITPRPQRHGAYSDPGYKEGGVWSCLVVCPVIGRTSAAIDADMNDLVGSVNAMIKNEGTVTWTDPTQGAMVLTVRAYDDVKFTWDLERGAWVCAVVLHSDKPYATNAHGSWEDSTALTSVGSGWTIPLTIPFDIIGSGGGLINLTNSGNVAGYPLLRFMGPLNNPVLYNRDTDEYLYWSGGSIAAGDYWGVDMFLQRVTLNSDTPGEGTKISSLDPSVSTWFGIRPAGQAVDPVQLQLGGSGYTGTTLLRAWVYDSFG